MESDYHLPDKSTGTQTVPTTSTTTTTQPPKGDSESTLSTSSPSSPSKPPELIDTDDSTEQICDPHIFNDLSELTNSFRETLEEFRKEILKPNVLVVGTTGAGKSSLINTIFGEKVAQEGTGKPVTTHFNRYEPETLPVVIYDSKGLEHGNTAEFITSTEQFFEDVGASLQATIHVVWYVINGPGSRIQPFEEEIWRSLFKDIPILFIINKGDIATDSDRAMIREAINGRNLASCRGIFDMVSGTRDPVLNVSACPACGSDDIEVRKRKRTATCAACGHAFSIQATSEELIKTTLKILPDRTREAFISAQSASCSHKDLRAKLIMHEYARNAQKPGGAVLGEMIKVLVRLASMWNFQRYGMSVSHTIVDTMFRRAISLSKVKALVLKFGGSSARTLLEHTIPVAIIWNRCLRKLFILTSFGIINDHDMPQKDLPKLIAASFDSLNQEEHAEVLNFFVTNGLDALLEREMPEATAQGADPVIPQPFTTHSPGAQSLLPKGPVKVRKALDVPDAASPASVSASASPPAFPPLHQAPPASSLSVQQQVAQGACAGCGGNNGSCTQGSPKLSTLPSGVAAGSPKSKKKGVNSPLGSALMGDDGESASGNGGRSCQCQCCGGGGDGGNDGMPSGSVATSLFTQNGNTNTDKINTNSNTHSSNSPSSCCSSCSGSSTPTQTCPNPTFSSYSNSLPALRRSADSVNNECKLHSPTLSSRSPANAASSAVPPPSLQQLSSALSSSMPPSTSQVQMHLSPPLRPSSRSSGTATPVNKITLGETRAVTDVTTTKLRTASHSEATINPPKIRGAYQSFSPPPPQAAGAPADSAAATAGIPCGCGGNGMTQHVMSAGMSPAPQDESPTAVDVGVEEDDSDSKSSGDGIKLDRKEIEKVVNEELECNKEEEKDLRKTISEKLKGGIGSAASSAGAAGASSRRSLDIAQPSQYAGLGSVKRENSQGSLCYSLNTHNIK